MRMIMDDGNWDSWDFVGGFWGFRSWLFGGLVSAFAGMTCIRRVFMATPMWLFVDGYPPPAPFQGRRVGIIFWFSTTSPLDVTWEVGSWGRMYCPGP